MYHRLLAHYIEAPSPPPPPPTRVMTMVIGFLLRLVGYTI
jgi:hypothetical protein